MKKMIIGDEPKKLLKIRKAALGWESSFNFEGVFMSRKSSRAIKALAPAVVWLGKIATKILISEIKDHVARFLSDLLDDL